MLVGRRIRAPRSLTHPFSTAQCSSVTGSILESGQIADWILEQFEHTYVFKQEGRCESASYDISGNTWKRFEVLDGKIKNKSKLVQTLENFNDIVHMDDCAMDDFDALVVAKLLRYKCDKAKLLDLNNNPLVNDMGLAHVCRHVLDAKSSVKLRSLFMSGCGITDDGVAHLVNPLAWPEQGLQILELRKNEITDRGAEELARVIGKSKVPGGFSLYLNDNRQIGPDGVLALAKAAIEAQGNLKVYLKNIQGVSDHDKAEVMKLTKNRVRF